MGLAGGRRGAFFASLCVARRRRGRPSVRCSQPEGGAPAPGAAEEQGEWEGEELEGEEEGEEEGRGEEQARRARCMCACRRGARVSPFFPFIFFSILSLIDILDMIDNQSARLELS